MSRMPVGRRRQDVSVVWGWNNKQNLESIESVAAPTVRIDDQLDPETLAKFQQTVELSYGNAPTAGDLAAVVMAGADDADVYVERVILVWDAGPLISPPGYTLPGAGNPLDPQTYFAPIGHLFTPFFNYNPVQFDAFTHTIPGFVSGTNSATSATLGTLFISGKQTGLPPDPNRPGFAVYGQLGPQTEAGAFGSTDPINAQQQFVFDPWMRLLNDRLFCVQLINGALAPTALPRARVTFQWYERRPSLARE